MDPDPLLEPPGVDGFVGDERSVGVVPERVAEGSVSVGGPAGQSARQRRTVMVERAYEFRIQVRSSRVYVLLTGYDVTIVYVVHEADDGEPEGEGRLVPLGLSVSPFELEPDEPPGVSVADVPSSP